MNKPSNIMQFGSKVLDLSTPNIMGILNVTPDSFSDGGNFNQIDNALNQVEMMIAAGASIIDVGGESTRPGAKDVELQEELARVIPVIKAIKQRFEVVISIDTSKAEVMQAAIDSGAGLINDVRALQNEGCVEVVANSDLPVCLMHMQGMPRTMQTKPQYNNVVDDVETFFKQRIQVCQQAGIDKNRIIIDPGYGFGKTLEQNYQLLANQQQLLALGTPILAGISRKSMIGNLLDAPVEQRLAGSLSAAVLACINGAKIIRVHDVKETVDAIKVLSATLAQQAI
ncbi:dihydropteroate synthase [Thalassotalea sp. ND16A]|uniref:dihydropteroate synthase n=1 Tax=Thalassotalea sp. ND16A TaxID=1535422 RepID=UPI00051D5BC8|nr:dihydropteroate synthase [Thalassotalea sp. ND16A]KGJ95829.1 Dihydropteroate synthase [Thalassotalea sp. ND16A]